MSRCQEESPAPDAAGAPFQYGQTSASSAGIQPAEHAQSTAQARDGQGHAPQLLQETHQNFKVIRQPRNSQKNRALAFSRDIFIRRKLQNKDRFHASSSYPC